MKCWVEVRLQIGYKFSHELQSMFTVFLLDANSVLLRWPGRPRALGGPGAKLENEALCERSEQNFF